MSPEELNLLKQFKDSMKVDLDNFAILMKDKQKDFLKIELLIQQYDNDLDEMAAEHTKKVVIDCINIDEEE